MRQGQPFDQPGPGLIEGDPEFGRTGLRRTRASHDNQIDTLQQWLMMTEGFTHNTLETVALYSKLEVFLCGNQAEAARGRISHPVCK